MACVLCWILVSAAESGDWRSFWGILGCVLFAGLVNLLKHVFGKKPRKMVYKNLTHAEKEEATGIAEQLGLKLGIRIAPLVFLIVFLKMTCDRAVLFYAIPVSVILLIVLCIPIWKKNKEQADALYLSSTYAQDNGITTI